MRVLIISTTIFQLQEAGLPGYGGLENLVITWSKEFRRLGHQVSVVCPKGSNLGEGIEIIPVPLRCGEDVAWQSYKDRLLKGEWSAIMDNSWSWFSVISQMQADRQLPVIHCYHSDPYNLGNPPPIEKPCLVAFSEAQANIMRRRWNVAVQVVNHGIDLNFYKPNPEVQRSNRYLFLARYTPEKGFLELANLARKCRVPLDAYGDTSIVSDEGYVRRCFAENDGYQIRVMPGINREQTVKEYQSHKALLTWPNFLEIWGLTTTEGMACGCPVISKDSGAAKEQIRQGKSGFVVQSLDELEELIKTDAVSKLKTEDIVKQGRKFSIERSARGHLRCLTDVSQGLYW